MEEKDLRSSALFELQILNHQIKRYADGLADAHKPPHMEAGKGLSGTNIAILGYLFTHRNQETYQKDLEGVMNVRRSTISKVLQGMEKKKLITRVQAEHDSRLKRIRLTPESEENILFWMENFNTLAEKLTRGFDREELTQLRYLVEKARKNMDD